MKLTHSLAAIIATTALAFPLTGHAGPQLQIPDFSHLRSKAVDSVDITLDGFLMKVAKHFAAADGDDQDESLSILNDVKSVQVRNFEFDTDDAYSREDVETVRKQLSGPGWSPLVQTHERDPRSDVDIFINAVDGKILGLAVISSEPRSFTIVNIIGNIDIDKLAKIEGAFGIPKFNKTE